MTNLSDPYPTYIPNKAVASCVTAVVGISLIAWLIQSIQTRFQPRRVSILLLASHMVICAGLIVWAAVYDNENSKTMFSVLTSLFTVGVRMIIIANFSFVLEVHHEKTRRARRIFLGIIAAVLTSAILMIVANTSSSNSDGTNASFHYRKISALILLGVTVGFYVILYWSQTIKDMKMQAIILIMTSSTLCLPVIIVNTIESISLHYYEEIINDEGFFYGLQMAPIILAHIAWSIFHPKRSLKSLEISHDAPTNEQQPLLI